MAYSIDMADAAHKLLHSADKLNLADSRERDCAGYLYGLAAECAIKAMSQSLIELRDEKVLYAHFMALRTEVRDRLRGRRAAPLQTLLQHNNYLNDWSIDLRYARRGATTMDQVVAWRDQAKQTLRLMETT